MDAEPVLRLIARTLAERRLAAVLIGNAAAALQGSPVTTLDLDLMFRKTPANLRKLKAVADDLDAVVMRPYFPVSDLYRVVRDRDALQLDFMAKIDGVRSFAGPRRTSTSRKSPRSERIFSASGFHSAVRPFDGGSSSAHGVTSCAIPGMPTTTTASASSSTRRRFAS